jgi:hypothetical protein
MYIFLAQVVRLLKYNLKLYIAQEPCCVNRSCMSIKEILGQFDSNDP